MRPLVALLALALAGCAHHVNTADPTEVSASAWCFRGAKDETATRLEADLRAKVPGVETVRTDVECGWLVCTVAVVGRR